MADVIRIGNAQGFWGDSVEAPARLVAQAPQLDVLTLDYLAEVSMSILAKQRQRDASLGYARDFLDVVRSLAPEWKSGRPLKLVTNAGGLNPRRCADACAAALREAGVTGLKIGVVSGDDVLPALQQAHAADALTNAFAHLETGEKLDTIFERVVTANAYIGAAPVAEVLQAGATIVVTGRVADPSLTVGPCLAHFGWRGNDFDAIAGATVAGHLIECGTQVTGGISTDWLSLDFSRGDIGYPIVEVAGDSACVVTKPASTGGSVNARTVKEQLVYELGDPARYLSPDATVSFLNLRVDDLGDDRVRVTGAAGGAPPDMYKVSATYRAGYRASGMLTMFGRDAVAKARRAGEMVLRRLSESGARPQHSLVECLGAGACAPGVVPVRDAELIETVLRISVADERREVVERFTKEIAPLVATGPQGTTGYAEGRPQVRELFGYWPCLVARPEVHPVVEVLEV